MQASKRAELAPHQRVLLTFNTNNSVSAKSSSQWSIPQTHCQILLERCIVKRFWSHRPRSVEGNWTCFGLTKNNQVWFGTLLFPSSKFSTEGSANLCLYLTTQATLLQPTVTLFLTGKSDHVAKFHKWGKKLANQRPTIWFAGKKLFKQCAPPLLTRSQVNTFKFYRRAHLLLVLQSTIWTPSRVPVSSVFNTESRSWTLIE